MLGPAEPGTFDQNLAPSSALARQMCSEGSGPFRAQASGPFLDHDAVELRHPCGRCPGPRREGEDVEMAEAAVVDDRKRVLEHRFGFCGESGDQVSAEDDVRPPPSHLGGETDRIGTAVAPLHTFEDHVVARLQGEMKVGHQPFFLGNRAHQGVVDLDRIDRRQAQPLEFGHRLEDRANQRSEAWAARQIGAVGGDVDAGEYHLAVAVRS